MNRRLKLLFVVTEDWYFVSHRLSLAVAAQKSGFDVVVATREGVCGETIQATGIRLIPFSLSRRCGNPLREVVALVRLYRLERPDIVHHVALKPIVYGAISAWVAGVPAQMNAVVGLGWLVSSYRRGLPLLRPAVRWGLTRLLNARGSLTTVQNPEDRAVFIRANLPESCLRLVRGVGVDTALFYPARVGPLEPVCIMLPARMLWDKGVGEFISAARLLTQSGVSARFVLVGDSDSGSATSISTEILRAWHGHNGVEWWGQCNNMPAMFHKAHIVCLPSYREGLPKVLLEASACGLPIVTTDVPGCREVVRDGHNGILVPARDVQMLAQALRVLINDGNLRAKMGERSREIALAEFSQDRVIEETLAVYRELVEGIH